MPRIGRLVVVLATLGPLMLAHAAPVEAHAELLASSPQPGASLAEPPDRVDLEFSEPVAPDNASVDLVDVSGRPVDGTGEVSVAADGETVTLELPDLEAAVYTVRFRVVSALDGHATEGTFAFQVDPTGMQPPLTGTVTSTTPNAGPATVVARWAGLGGALGLFGTALFWLVTGRAALALVEPAGERRGVWRMMAAFSLTALSGLAIFLTLSSRGLATAQPGGDHSRFALDFAGPFGDTLFANAMRVVEIASFAAFCLAVIRATASEQSAGRSPPVAVPAAAGALPERRGEGGALVAMIVLAALALAGYSAAGHVSAAGGPLFAVIDWAHLVAVATWLGTLPGLLLLFGYARGVDGASRQIVLRAALRRHSAIALVAAPVVALTGIANSPVVVGESRNLIGSDYGTLVLAKILLFGMAVAIGSANFFLLRRASFRRIAGTVAAELGIGALAVLVAASLGTTPPAGGRPDRAVAPPTPTLVLDGEASDLSVQLVVTAPAPGRQLYQVSVLAADGVEPPPDIQRLFLRFEPPPGSGLTPQRVEADQAPDDPGLFRISGTHTPVVGDWSIEVIVRRAGMRDASVSFDVPVRAADAPETLPPRDSGLGVPAPLRAAWSMLPPPPFEWLLSAALFALAGAALFAQARWPRLSPRARTAAERVRLGIVGLAVATALLAGSRILVTTVNAAPEAARRASNPVPPSAASITRGAIAYDALCAACHRGDHLDLDAHTDGELYHWITNGIAGTSMPPFATELAPRDRWDVINYLRSLSAREPR